MSSDRNKKIKNYRFGYFAEYMSIIFLLLKGYIPIAHRHRNHSGEVDIILQHVFSKTLIFVEVKARGNKGDMEVITAAQKNRISKAASFFLATRPKYSDYAIRFDLIIFNKPLSLKHIKNAWIVDAF